MHKKTTIIFFILTCMLILTSCGSKTADYNYDHLSEGQIANVEYYINEIEDKYLELAIQIAQKASETSVFDKQGDFDIEEFESHTREMLELSKEYLADDRMYYFTDDSYEANHICNHLGLDVEPYYLIGFNVDYLGNDLTSESMIECLMHEPGHRSHGSHSKEINQIIDTMSTGTSGLTGEDFEEVVVEQKDWPYEQSTFILLAVQLYEVREGWHVHFKDGCEDWTEGLILDLENDKARFIQIYEENGIATEDPYFDLIQESYTAIEEYGSNIALCVDEEGNEFADNINTEVTGYESVWGLSTSAINDVFVDQGWCQEYATTCETTFDLTVTNNQELLTGSWMEEYGIDYAQELNDRGIST